MAGVSGLDTDKAADQEADDKDDDLNQSGVFIDDGYKNWLKGVEGLVLLQKGLAPFVDREIQNIHTLFLDRLPLSCIQGTSGCGCTFQNVLPDHAVNLCRLQNCLCKGRGRRRCPNEGYCSTFCQLILNEHRTGDPLWKNSDLNAWPTDHWSIAKCYQTMPTHSSSAQMTDASGLLSIIINGKFFKTKVTSQLGQPGDFFLKARNMRNDILHRAKVELSDAELQDILDTFVVVLKDPASLLHDTDAILAVRHLELLKSDQVKITSKEEIEILKRRKEALKEIVKCMQRIEKAASKAKESIDAKAKQVMDELRKLEDETLRKVNKARPEAVKYDAAAFERQIDDRLWYIEEKKKACKVGDSNSAEGVYDIKQEILDQTLKVLKEDLIEYYRQKESTMSVAPLVEQHETEITNFYVRPPMMAYNKPNSFGQEKQSDENSMEKKSKKRTKIQSYRELLLNGNDQFRRIYVTADAGMGKTSFAKMLAVTWCKAHAAKGRLIRETLNSDDIDTMENFDFLFLIKLCDFQTSPKCSLDEMILEMMKSKLQHRRLYTEELVEKIICNKRCLIIVDGLDEWIHPPLCRRGEVIPHRRAWTECTVLTTTRPWKLSTARLSMADIDRQVEISQLDKTTAHELESRALEILKKNQRQNDPLAVNTNTKTAVEFENSVPEQILGRILYIPFVLLQIICFWFGNSLFGKSLCEVYSNIIELTLNRWLDNTDSGHTDCECEPSMEHENFKLKCMENSRHCQRYMPLLLKIGELAFSTLFNVIRETSLVFDEERVLKYLSKEELKQCLDMRLLSQVKDPTSLTEVRLQLYFPHKTLHEFFSALFIATHWNNTKTGTLSIIRTISNKCTSVSDILEMSQVFMFVCGLNPEVYSDISRHFATIVSKDQSVIDYRNSVKVYSRLLEYSCLLEDYQRMQISCFLEGTRNQHTECKIVIEDIFLGRMLYGGMEEDEKRALVKILPDSACSMKSLTLYFRPAGEILQILEHAEFPCLEHLNVRECELTLFFASAAHSLKSLQLGDVSLTDDMCNVISGLNNLQGLNLEVIVSSESLNAVSDCISNLMLLQKLRLDFRYKHSDTDDKPEQRKASIYCLLRSIEAKTLLNYLALSGFHGHQNDVLDLSKHVKLQGLDLELPLELHIDTERLVTCDVYRMDELSAPAVSSLLAELHGAPLLETLTLGNIRNPSPRIDIPTPRLTEFTLWRCDLRNSTVALTPPQLTEFIMWRCDLRDSTVTLSPEMTSLETITLRRTTVNIPCCRGLFLSISKLPHPITVQLERITMTVGEWRELLFYILGKMPRSIHVEMESCSGPSREEWRNIYDDMQSSPVFCVTRTGWARSGTDIFFDTVGV